MAGLTGSERKRFIFFLDLFLLNFSLFIAIVIRPEYRMDLGYFIKYPQWFLIFTGIWLLIAHAFDCYDPNRIEMSWKSFWAIIEAGFVSSLIYLFIPYITPLLPRSRTSLIGYFLIIISFLLAGRALFIFLLGSKALKRKVLILGTGKKAALIARAINEYGKNLYKVVGFIAIEENLEISDNQYHFNQHSHENNREKNDTIEYGNLEAIKSGDKSINNLMKESNDYLVSLPGPILGHVNDLISIVREYSIQKIILAHAEPEEARILNTLVYCLELGVGVVPGVVLYEELTGMVPIEIIDHEWKVAMPVLHPGTTTFWPMVKRIMDIVLSSIGLIFISLLTPIIAAAIYIDSPGQIFYIQERVGKGGKFFKLIKFRTMRRDAEKEGPVWAKKNDERTTRVGRFLRRTHLDEFPQFINILKGEMSVVGPRAERPEFVEQLKKEIPFYNVRHAVKPGMAGWALVKQGYVASKEDALVRLQYDLYYIKHQSLWLDLVILVKTIIKALSFKGRA